MGGKTSQERCTIGLSAGSASMKMACEMSADGKSWAPVFEGVAAKMK
jgi:hypothetical protein